MTEKRRLTRTRVHWVKDTSLKEDVPVENSSAVWAGLSAEDDPSSWGMFPEEEEEEKTEELLPKTELAETGFSREEEALSGAGTPTDSDLLAEDALEEEFYPEDVAEEEFYPEDAALAEQQFLVEGQSHPLFNAVLILVALYIVCGVAPLFFALFVSLRVFFWLEIAGWVIILGWLALGVRPPLQIWIKERRQVRQEQSGNELG